MRAGLLKITADEFAGLARRIVPLHATYSALGFHLVSTNRWVHIDRRGQITARFVYRRANDTVTHVAKGMQVEWT